MEVQTEMNSKQESPRLLGMFTSPGMQFDRIRENPKIWVALLVATILYAIGTGFMALSINESTLGDLGVQLSEDETGLVLIITRVSTVFSGMITPVLSALFSTVVLLVIAKIASLDVTFKKLFSMNVYIMIIGAVGLIINASVIFATGSNPLIQITSLAGLLNEDKPGGVLGSIEVFVIWAVILKAIGLNRTAGFSKGAAWTIALVLFLLQIGIALAGTLLQGAPKL